MLRAIAFGLVGYLIGGVIVRVARGEAGSRSPPDHGGPLQLRSSRRKSHAVVLSPIKRRSALQRPL